jgi:hypothetical protein
MAQENADDAGDAVLTLITPSHDIVLCAIPLSGKDATVSLPLTPSFQEGHLRFGQ